MKIESSALQMQARHAATRVHAQTSRLEMWVGERRPATQTVRISPAAQAAAAQTVKDVPPAKGKADDEGLTPRLAMVRDLIERMTGVRVRMRTAPDDAAQAPAADTRPRAPAGFGVIYEHHEVLEETEQTRFAAQGTIRTADGREIRFELQLDMQRSYREESSVSLRLGDAAVAVDPLVINFDGTAAQLQDLRFAFDLDGDGRTEAVPLLAGNRGYLALDANGNQRIDNGLELFGPGTGNGFAELARHDSDLNGWIDEADPVFQQLQVWTPEADGPGSLRSLRELGVGAIQLAATETPFALRTAGNASLGAVRSTGVYLREDGGVGTVQQIDLSV